ncbi:MAG: DNA primase [Verrucomicrobia bacterium]|nr:DNA primase [Verrucomicrobiota bacterium]
MPRISPETIEQVAAALNIVDVIGSYFPLKRAGVEFRALCPFHQEKTPSFYVNPDKQTFYCFGCGRGGSVFQFVQEYEHIDFPEAVRRLAHRAAIPIIEAEPSPEEQEKQNQRKRLLRLHFEAADWFHRNLLRTKAGEIARDYMRGRQLNIEIARQWRIGYAPSSWTAFRTWAVQAGFSKEELVVSGLVKLRDEGNPRSDVYDRFRDRLMFPITNELGEVVAFSGRVLQPKAPGGKYINSPESPLFSKGNLLFGLEKSKRGIAQSRQAVVLEGQVDLIVAFAAGIDNVVAPLGTALTERHASLLKRFATEVILFFDADAAGERAGERAIEVLYAAGLQVRLGRLPAGEDPDSLIRKEGAEQFRLRIGQAKDFLEHELERSATRDQSVAQRVESAHRIARFIGLISEPVLRDTIISRVMARLSLSREAVEQAIASHRKGSGRSSLLEPIETGIAQPEHKISALCNIFMTDVATLRWVRGQPWKEILVSVTGTEILAKILDSDLQSDNPASVSAFLGTLEAADAAVLSNALALKPIELARRSYWCGFVQQEIRLRKSRIEGTLRLNSDKPEAYAQAQGELNRVLELESRFASDFENVEPKPQ